MLEMYCDLEGIKKKKVDSLSLKPELESSMKFVDFFTLALAR